MSNETFLLKIFSGPHVGAEVILGSGVHVIGSDDSCDVILNDRFIAPRHAKITISGNTIHCTALDDGSVFINGHPISEQALEPYQYFTLGNTHLAIGSAQGQWPVREFPEFRLDIPTPEPTPTLPDSATESGAELVEQPALPAPRARRPLLWMAAIAVVVVLLNGGAGYYVLRGSLGDDSNTVDRAGLETRLQQILDEIGGEGLRLRQDHNGYSVEGYVLTANELTDLQSALEDVDPSIQLDVWATDQAAKLVDEVISRMHLKQLRTSIAGPGAIVVEGALEDLSQWQAAKSKIFLQVPAIGSGNLIDQVRSLQANTGGHRPAARDSGVARSAIPTTRTIQTVVYRDRPTDKSSSEQDEKSESPSPASAQITPQRPPIILPVQSVHIGVSRRLVLRGPNGSPGARLQEGAMLPNGYTLKSIEPDMLVLTRQGIEYPIRLGEAN